MTIVLFRRLRPGIGAPRIRRVVLSPLLSLLAGCGTSAADGALRPETPGPPVATGPVATISLAYDTIAMALRQSLTVEVTARDSAGRTVTGKTPTWISSDESIVGIEGTRLVARAAGKTTATATIEGKSASAVVTVIAFASITSASDATCALTAAGVLYCAGEGFSSRARPVSPGIRWKQIAGSGWQSDIGHFCGVTVADELMCWGNNSDGQVGPGSGSSPSRIELGGAVRQVSVGDRHTCAVTETDGGSLYCWGDGEYGQLGNGLFSDRNAPVRVASATAFARVAAGGRHTCALTTAGGIQCWGANELGQLGRGGWSEGNAEPAPVRSDVKFKDVSAYSGLTCGLSTTSMAHCWGNNRAYIAGQSTSDRCRADAHECVATPTPVQGGKEYVAIAASGFGGCGLASNGDVSCWGLNAQSSLGVPDASLGSCYVIGARPCTPTPVIGPTSFTTLSGSGWHYCGIQANGGAYCWGSNRAGQLGDPGVSESSTPVVMSVEISRSP